MRYFNLNNNGFYTPGLNLPTDADLSQYVPISEDEFRDLMTGQGVNGMVIKVVNGRPVLGPIDPPAVETQVALATKQKATLMTAATQAIAPYQAAVDLNMATAEETALLTQWKTYLVLLNRVDVTASSIVWPVVPTTAPSAGGVTVVS